ncbi:MAG: 30S ribosomal protein S4 [Bacillota bacterium]
MARHTGPVCVLCRREGMKLFLKGQRCYTPKCALSRRSYPPGEHGQEKRKMSEYAMQLREKQRARRIYGVLERQFRRYFRMAARKRGVTGETLLQLLERRLDNVVFRLGFAQSRRQARQIVLHGHIQVNGRKVNVPSYMVRPGDKVSIAPKSRELDLIKSLIESGRTRTVPQWLEVSYDNFEGTVLRLPSRDEIDTPIQEHLIVELYSK